MLKAFIKQIQTYIILLGSTPILFNNIILKTDKIIYPKNWYFLAQVHSSSPVFLNVC